MNIPIFCINLERATERRAKTQRLWVDGLGLDITFIKAWDRRDIDAGKFLYEYDPKATQSAIGRQLTSGEIACSTSHCIALQRALDSGAEHCIVMEDDVLPSPGVDASSFERVLLVREELPECSVVLLHEIHEFMNKVGVIKDTPNFRVLCRPPWGTQMTFYTRDGMEKVLQALRSMRYASDNWKAFPSLSVTEDICVAKRSLCRHETSSSPDKNTYIGVRTPYCRNYIP